MWCVKVFTWRLYPMRVRMRTQSSENSLQLHIPSVADLMGLTEPATALEVSRVAADVVYDPALFAPLVETLSQFGRAGTRRVLLAHVRRWKSDARFWKAARREWGVRDVTGAGGDGADGPPPPARRSSSHERGAQKVFELIWKGV